MKDTTPVQSEQDSLTIIHQVAGKTPPSQTQTKAEAPAAAAALALDEVALPELTDEFSPKKKVRRSIPFQFVFFGTFLVGLLSVVRGCSTMSESHQAQRQEQAVATAPLEESERQELLRVINDQNLAIQQLQQGKRLDLRTGKDKALPKPPVSARTVNRVNQPTRRTPPPAVATARSIPLRRSVPQYRPQPAQPRVVYRDRVVYKPAPTPSQPQPVAAAPPRLQPVSRLSLSQKFEPSQAQPPSRPIQIKRLPYQPLRVSTTPINIKPSSPKPKLTAAESGVLVASNTMTGDLLQDMNQPFESGNGPASINEPEIDGTPSQTSLVRGSIPAGTRVKAAFANPLTWVAGHEGLAGQRVLLHLKGDLGNVAKAGSTAIGEVMSVQGDFAQVQIVEINGKPIDHVNLNDPEGSSTRTQPVAVVQYKDTPYLQAKAKNEGGSDLGGRLLRAGLNVGIDQLRDQGIGSSAGNVVNSLLPDRNRFSRGSNLYSFEGKDVEIYFLEGL